jgi:hypothetical protein
MISSTDASYAGVEESRRNRQQAQQALDATSDQFRTDQRAWVVPVSGTVTLDLKHTLRVDVIVQNIGKTPALKVSTILDWKYTPSGPLDLRYQESVKHVGRETIYPNGKDGMFVSAGRIPTQQDLDAIHAGKYIFYFFGSIDYKDVYGHTHVSRICNIVNTDLATVRQCDTNNEAN